MKNLLRSFPSLRGTAIKRSPLAKAATNKEKHKVSFDEARSVFFDEYAQQFYDSESSVEEDRFLMQFYYDLLDLKDHGKDGKVIGLQINDSLFASELVTPDFLPAYKGNEPEEPTTLLTEFGKILVTIGMGKT